MPSPTEHYKESAEYRELCRQFEICSENVDIIDRQIALSMLGKFVSYLKRPRRDLDLDILRCWFETAKQFFHSRRELYEARCSTNHPGASDSGEERTKRVPQLEEKIANFAAELWKDATPVRKHCPRKARPGAVFQADWNNHMVPPAKPVSSSCSSGGRERIRER